MALLPLWHPWKIIYGCEKSSQLWQLKRWKSIIEEYNCILTYKPGRSNVGADALSRLPSQITDLVFGIANAPEGYADSVAKVWTQNSFAPNFNRILPRQPACRRVPRNYNPHLLQHIRVKYFALISSHWRKRCINNFEISGKSARRRGKGSPLFNCPKIGIVGQRKETFVPSQKLKGFTPPF